MRPLREEEIALVRALLQEVPCGSHLSANLEKLRVEDMRDGGMGSIKFSSVNADAPRLFGMEVAEAEYSDIDGVFVSIALNLDRHGDLFELDIWKTDSSALDRYPSPQAIRILKKMCG